MTIPKKYFDDKVILLLLSVNSFLAVFTAISILLRLGSDGVEGYIVQYRSDQGLDAFSVGGLSDMVSFMVFSLIVWVFHILLSMKVHHMRRHFSVMILSLGTVLLVLSLVVSDALLKLR